MRKAAAAVRSSVKNNRQTATAVVGNRPAALANRPSAGAARRAVVPIAVATGTPSPSLKLVPKPGPMAVPSPPAAAPSGGVHEDFRRLLLARRQELTGNLEDTKFDTLARMGRVAEDDQAQISHEEFISLQRNSMDYQALRQVNAALERIHSGEFGICAHCDEPISEKRLKAIPWAKYCVLCQDKVGSKAVDNDDDEESAEASESW